MRELAKTSIAFIYEHNALIFYGTVAVVILVMLFSFLSAWRGRHDAKFYYGEDAADTEVRSSAHMTLSKTDYFVDVYGRKLLRGLIASTVLLVVICLPLLLLDWSITM